MVEGARNRARAERDRIAGEINSTRQQLETARVNSQNHINNLNAQIANLDRNRHDFAQHSANLNQKLTAARTQFENQRNQANARVTELAQQQQQFTDLIAQQDKKLAEDRRRLLQANQDKDQTGKDHKQQIDELNQKLADLQKTRNNFTSELINQNKAYVQRKKEFDEKLAQKKAEFERQMKELEDAHKADMTAKEEERQRKFQELDAENRKRFEDNEARNKQRLDQIREQLAARSKREAGKLGGKELWQMVQARKQELDTRELNIDELRGNVQFGDFVKLPAGGHLALN